MPVYTRVTADLFTATHRVSCRIEAGNMGTIGLLNDINTSVFPAEDAYVSRIAEPAKILEHHATLYVAKATLSLVFISRREELGPVGLARGGYTHILTFPVLIKAAAGGGGCERPRNPQADGRRGLFLLWAGRARFPLPARLR